MKNFLIISSEFPPGPGGIGRHAYSMATALVNNGINVHVVCNMDHANENAIKEFIDSQTRDLNIHRIRRAGIRTYYDRVKTILSLCRRNHFDKIILTGQFSLWMATILKTASRGSNIVSFVHGSELFIGGILKQRITIAGLANSDKIFAVSNYTANLTRNLIHKDVSILPNGLDLNQWHNGNIQDTSQWNGGPKLLTVGSVTPRKGQQNVVKALPELVKNYPNLHYHMVGMPTGKDAIVQLAKELNVTKHVTIHGQVGYTELRNAYHNADIFIMLSEQASNGDVEGFGIAILEANAVGVPAVGSRGSGIEDAIKDGCNGYLVDPKNVEEIVAAVDNILNKDKKVWASNCKQWAQEHDWNKLVKELL